MQGFASAEAKIYGWRQDKNHSKNLGRNRGNLSLDKGGPKP